MTNLNRITLIGNTGVGHKPRSGSTSAGKQVNRLNDGHKRPLSRRRPGIYRFVASIRVALVPDPVVIPEPPPILLPIRFSDSQPLPGVELDVQSMLREILERRLPKGVLRKV